MTTTTTETMIKTKSSLKRNKLLLKPDITQILLKSDLASPVIAMPTIPSSPLTTGSFCLPIKQKNNRKGRYHQKHLRKPPSFDTYLHSSAASTTATPCGYLTRTTRTPSISSSYSSTSSLVDNEDLLYGYGFKSNNHSTPSVHSARLRRGSSAFKVRFAEDDGSSIVSSSSGGSCADDWDDIEDDEEEEEYILVPQQPPQHYFNYHNKN